MSGGPFRVIQGTPAPDTAKEQTRTRLKRQPKPAHIVRCPRCTGLAMIEVKLGMELYNGKPRGGQKQIVCATCLQGGEYVLVTF